MHKHAFLPHTNIFILHTADTYIYIHTYMYADIHTDRLIDMWAYNIHSCIHAYIHIYVHTYIHGDLCMPHTVTQRDTHVYLQTNKKYIHTYIQVKHFNLESHVILELCICTLFRFANFPYFQNF